MENSLFVFHINKLNELGLLEKKNSKYFLSELGKEYSNRMDENTYTQKEFPKTTTILCCVRKNKGKTEYLIYRRKKNPFFNHMGFPTHKVFFSEKIYNAAIDGLFEETSLKGTGKLMGIRHYHVIKEGKILEDKIMYIYRFENPVGEIGEYKEGEYFWVEKSKIKTIVDKPLPEFFESFSIINGSKTEFFKEVDQIVTIF